MNNLLKVVMNPETNGIIFIYEEYEVAFSYYSFIGLSREGTPYEQFIKEFAINPNGSSLKPDAEFMEEDMRGYIHSSLGNYVKEYDHEAAVVVYTKENGFGIQ